MDVVPRVVTFAKHTTVIQLVVNSEPSTPKSEETRGGKRKIVSEDDKERKSGSLKEGTNYTYSILYCSLSVMEEHSIFSILLLSSCLGLALLGGTVLVKENEV